MEFEHLTHPYLDEEEFTRNQVFWTGNIGLLFGWLAVDSFKDLVFVAGLWILADIILYAYETDHDLVNLNAAGKAGDENQ